MRYFVTLLAILVWSGILFAENQPEIKSSQDGFSESKIHQKDALSWNDFDRHSGKVQLNAGANFFGSTIAYMHKGSSRLLYGFNLDVLASNSSAPTNNLFANQFSQSSFLIPLQFSMKFRLIENPYSKLSPYVITGAGPTLGFQFTNGASIFNSFSNLQANLGAAGYLGGGVDLLWMNDWAISADIRYNVMYFDTPLSLSNEYTGFSFGIGFMRAFGL